MATRYVVEIVSPSGRPWGYSPTSHWSPAFTGNLNQTGRSDDAASTFDSRDAAEDALESIYDSLDGDDDFRFRITEVCA